MAEKSGRADLNGMPLSAPPLRWMAGIALTGILGACAQMRGLEGGEKDTTPPQALSVSPPHLSTAFSSTTIVFEFDEYVELNDLAQELIVSPPLTRAPVATLRRRTLTLELREELLPHTTYTFNFGNSVVDLREGNPADLVYVVSTGPVIDSLQFTGSVTDAWTRATKKGVRVFLYPVSDTTQVLRQRPRYFARTEEDGSFVLPYLAAGEYHLAALDDENADYIHQDEEPVAFIPGTVRPSPPDSVGFFALELSTTTPRAASLPDYSVDSLGVLKFPWDRRLELPEVRSIAGRTTVVAWNSEAMDSLYCWLQGVPAEEEEAVVVAWRDSVLDTVFVPYFQEYRNRPFALQPVSATRLSPGRPTVLRSTVAPLELATDPALVLFTRDSIAMQFPAQLLGERPHELVLSGEGLPPGNYSLVLLQGAVRHPDGSVNDTLAHSFTVMKPEETGVLSVALRSDKAYEVMLELSDAKGKVRWSGKTELGRVWKLAPLEPGEYTLRAWRDDIPNGQWDGADVYTWRQPEPVWVMPQKIAVRANWDLNLEWVFPESEFSE